MDLLQHLVVPGPELGSIDFVWPQKDLYSLVTTTIFCRHFDTGVGSISWLLALTLRFLGVGSLFNWLAQAQYWARWTLRQQRGFDTQCVHILALLSLQIHIIQQGVGSLFLFSLACSSFSLITLILRQFFRALHKPNFSLRQGFCKTPFSEHRFRGSTQWCDLRALSSSSTRRSPGPNSRRVASGLTQTAGCVLLLIFVMWQHGGEGSSSSMGAAEASTQWFHDAELAIDAKQHGLWPTLCFGTRTMRPSENKVVKRSLIRAHKRALLHGFSWCKGRCMTPSDFGNLVFAADRKSDPEPAPCNSGPQRSAAECNWHHAPRGRISCATWNCGGLSQHKFDEIRLWLQYQQIHLAGLTETHWSFTNTWSDNWLCLHSGDSGCRGAGIAVLVAKSLCTDSQLQWQELIPGRLLHMRLNLPGRPTDVVCGYQFTSLRSKENLRDREHWWAALDKLMHCLPRRNNLLVAGDFNCSAPFLRALTGDPHYRWHKKLLKGPQHPDLGRFAEILKTHGLVILNSWNAAQGPTYKNGEVTSRIDFVMTRLNSADGIAKDVKHLWNVPFMTGGTWGHALLLCSIKRHWIPFESGRTHGAISRRQRLMARAAMLAQDDNWTAFLSQATSALQECFDHAMNSDVPPIETMHDTTAPIFHSCFAQPKLAISPAPWKRAENFVLNEWEHRQKLLAIR